MRTGRHGASSEQCGAGCWGQEGLISALHAMGVPQQIKSDRKCMKRAIKDHYQWVRVNSQDHHLGVRTALRASTEP